MSTTINNYPVFEDSQVLTSGQLNQMIKYLDQQNRLTRVSLIGMGIVCGMKLSCETTDEGTTLTISKGVGVTSEGFLITIGDCPTTRYRVYNKPDSVSYPPFEHEDLVLHELLTGTAITTPEEEIFDLDEAFLADKVVLLYLECFDKDLKSCLGKSCDELGVDRIFTLRKLVVDKAQLEDLIWPNLGSGENEGLGNGKPASSFSGKQALQPFLWKRPKLHAEVSTYYEMCLKYIELLASDSFMENLSQTYAVYEPILNDIYENPFDTAIITDAIAKIAEYINSHFAMERPLYGVQYIYDFVKDLALAYDEFRMVAYDLASNCCPDQSIFPKHLMLGEACVEIDELCALDAYRNEFTPSPVLDKQGYLRDKVRFLHKRMVLLIESFDLERLLQPTEWDLKITPSCEKKGTLSQRSIPYYYDSKRQSQFEKLGNLESNWNFELHRKCYCSDYPQQLSYDNHQFGKTDEHPITTPLAYDLDQFNFLRIEGILGKPKNNVVKEIEAAKKTWQLAFDVKAVYFGDLLKERPCPPCIAADLQPAYSIWRNKRLLFLNNLIPITTSLANLVSNRKEYSEALKTMSTGGSTGAGAKEKKQADDTFSFINRMVDSDQFFKVVNEKGEIDLSSISGRFVQVDMELANATQRGQARKSTTFASSTDNQIDGIFADINNCLKELVQAMPEDLKDFSMSVWLDKYKCALRRFISAMIFLAQQANSSITMLLIYFILVIASWVYRAIAFMAIYPYITIRTLYDTLQERIDRLVEAMNFAHALESSPGMEHKAGVAPGQTFIVVHQQPHEQFESGERIEGGGILKLLDKLDNNQIMGSKNEFDLEKVELKTPDEVAEKMNDLVVADFTLPYICCDDCANLPHTPLPLDPLVLPMFDVAKFEGRDFRSYRTLKRQVLNNLYDPDVYKVKLLSTGRLGTAQLIEDIYLPEPAKQRQLIQYDVDIEAVVAELQNNPNHIFVDDFQYEVRDVTRNEVIDKETFTVFIPVMRASGGKDVGRITGKVLTVENEIPIRSANVSVKGTTIEAITDSAGNYSINNIPVGSQTLQVDSIGYKSKTVTLNILAGTNEKDIFLETDISGVRTVGGKVTGVSANGEIGLGGVNIQLFTEVGKPAEYSQNTTVNGAYVFSEVESGTYMASAAYDGYLTDSKQVLVKSNDIKALNFRLKLARRLDFDLSKLRASLDVKEGTEMSEKLERYYSSRMGDYQQAIETMAKKAATPKMRKAINAVNKFTTAKTISSGNLNNTYDIAMNELIAAWDKSPADEKSAYIHGLQSITGAYLDRSAIVQRARLDKKSADQLENMARVFKANENLNMEPFLQEWLKQSEGYSTRAYKNNVKRYFNLS